MELYKQKRSPYWFVTFRQNGRRIRKSTKTENRKLAEQIAAKWLSEAVLEQHFGVKAPVLFSELIVNYARIHARDHYKSYKDKISLRLKKLNARFGNMIAQEINEADLRAWMNDRLDTVQKSTMRNELATVQAIFNMAIADGHIDTKPNFPKIKQKAGRTRWLTFEEERNLCRSVATAAQPYLVPLIRMAVETGGRRGELLGLDWRYVDMANGRLTFVETKNGSDRTIRLSKLAIDILKSLGPKESGPVFVGRSGKRMNDISTSFRKARNKAGLMDVHFHDLRHTCASRLIQRGVSVFDVMKFLGHSDPKMTMVYAHLSPDYQDQAIKVLNGLGRDLGILDAELPTPSRRTLKRREKNGVGRNTSGSAITFR